MACLVGRRHPEERVAVLRACLHPCASATWLLPVDSNHERGTLRQLLSLRRWLARTRGVQLVIEKPVFNLAPPALPSAAGRPVPNGGEPVIPDFVVRASNGRTAVVETMGYDVPAYRERKARMRAAMSRVCNGAAMVEHDFCLPADWPQQDRDAQFWRACHGALVGSVAAAGLHGAATRTEADAAHRAGPGG